MRSTDGDALSGADVGDGDALSRADVALVVFLLLVCSCWAGRHNPEVALSVVLGYVYVIQKYEPSLPELPHPGNEFLIGVLFFRFFQKRRAWFVRGLHP